MKDFFRQAGEVTYTDAHQRMGKNRGEVCFATREALHKAKDKFDGEEINGRRIKLKITVRHLKAVETVFKRVFCRKMARAVHPEVEVTHEAEVDHEAAPGADRAVDHEAVADLNRDHEAEVGEENHEPDQSREVHERIRAPPVVHVAAVDHGN